MNVLITGGLGFIGSNFCNYLQKKYSEANIVVLDKLSYVSSTSYITSSKVDIIKGDIRDEAKVTKILYNFNINIVVHFAAESHVDNSFFNSISFTENNVLGTHILLECCRKYQDDTNNIEKIIHISTDEVYGEVNDNIQRKECALLLPTNPYAASKASAELIANAYINSYNLPIVITRSNNVYGINQYPEKIIPKFIHQLLTDKKITIHGDGSSIRSFIYVDDLVKALNVILQKGVIGEIYNIGSHTHEYSVKEIALIILSLMGKDESCIEYVEDRKFNDKRYYIDSSKIHSLGWQEKHTDFIANLTTIKSWLEQHDFS